jgi:hypothetical protein
MSGEKNSLPHPLNTSHPRTTQCENLTGTTPGTFRSSSSSTWLSFSFPNFATGQHSVVLQTQCTVLKQWTPSINQTPHKSASVRETMKKASLVAGTQSTAGNTHRMRPPVHDTGNYCELMVGLGTHFWTLLEVWGDWELGCWHLTRNIRNRLCTPGIGGSKYRWSWIMITYHIHTTHIHTTYTQNTVPHPLLGCFTY